jgi:tetratricopeptide (TPR) repeat protein
MRTAIRHALAVALLSASTGQAVSQTDTCLKQPTRACLVSNFAPPGGTLDEEANRLDVLQSAGLLTSEQDIAKAIEYVKANPAKDRNLTTRLQWGVVNALTRLGKFDQAVAAAGTNGVYSDDQLNLAAAVWVEAKQVPKALQIIQGLPLHKQLNGYEQIGLKLIQAKRLDEAEGVIALWPPDKPSVRLSLAIAAAYLAQGEAPKAEATYRKALTGAAATADEKTSIRLFNLLDLLTLQLKLELFDQSRETVNRAIHEIENSSVGTLTVHGKADHYGRLAYTLAANKRRADAEALVSGSMPTEIVDSIGSQIARGSCVVDIEGCKARFTTITSARYRDEAGGSIAGQLANAGRFDEAVDVATSLSEVRRDAALTTVAIQLANQDRTARAIDVAGRIATDRHKRIAFLSIARVLK